MPRFGRAFPVPRRFRWPVYVRSVLDQNIIVGGIASGEAFGTAVVATGQFVLPGGIASAEAFGTPSLSYNQFIDLTGFGIASGEAFGSTTLSSGATVAFPPLTLHVQDTRTLVHLYDTRTKVEILDG